MSWTHGVDGAWEFLDETLRSGKALRARDREAIGFLIARRESGVDVTMTLAEYDDWQHRLASADDELKSLRAVARAAGEYLNARFWDEDEKDIEAAGEALASAMNAWKGIVR